MVPATWIFFAKHPASQCTALDNKLDDIRACISFQRDIRNCNVFWLNPGILDSTIQPGGGHCVPVHRHQPAGHGGLGNDAVLLWLPLHAGAGEAGVLCHHAAHRNLQTGQELCLPAGAQWAAALSDLGGHAMLHPQGHRHGHHEHQLRLRFLPAVVGKKIPDTPGQHYTLKPLGSNNVQIYA